MIWGLSTTVLWSGRGISKREIADRVRKMRVETLRAQVRWGGGLGGAWLRISHVIGHMITNDAIILWGVGVL